MCLKNDTTELNLILGESIYVEKNEVVSSGN